MNNKLKSKNKRENSDSDVEDNTAEKKPKFKLKATGVALQKKLAKKRMKKDAEKEETTYLSITRLGSYDTAKKKFHRLSSIETVPTQDTILEGIKAVCQEHFQNYFTDCQIQLSDKGKLVLDIKQLNLKKDFFCRFVDNDENARTCNMEEPQEPPFQPAPGSLDDSLHSNSMYDRLVLLTHPADKWVSVLPVLG